MRITYYSFPFTPCILLILFVLAPLISRAAPPPANQPAAEYYEDEHQELFYLQADMTHPVDVHIPSPLGKMAYYVYVRVPAETADKLNDVTGQLASALTPVDGVKIRAALPSQQAGMRWRCLGKAMVSRGDWSLRLKQWPADVPKADMLVCTWPRFIESGMADRWMAVRADARWAPSGVPLGGIGGGRVDICRDGCFRNFSMNNNQDAPYENPDGLPGAYLAMTVDGQTTDLATRPIVAGHRACAALEYTPRFPQAILRAPEIFSHVTARVTLTGTLIPHDLPCSSIPGFLVRWQVTNTGDTPRQVCCRMGWPNLIGLGGGVASAKSGRWYGDGYYHRWNDPSGRAERIENTTGYTVVHYTGMPAAAFLPSAGEHLLGVTGKEIATDAQVADGLGEVSATFIVPPGGQAEATMAVVTAMPHWIDSLGVDRGAFWQNTYADGSVMLTALLGNADDFFRETGALAALLDDGTLPEWMAHRLSNCIYPLVVNSILYKDGRFSVNEGPTEMAGCYGTMDQRLSAHSATQLFFPQLNARELQLFGAIQAANGGIAHDLGSGHIERGAGEVTWPDLTSSFIIQCARHAWSTGDTAFAKAMWPKVRKALLRQAVWAKQGHGVTQLGRELGTSYDSYHYIGTTGYVGTLWIAALNVCEKWAAQEKDRKLLADIARWRTAATQRLNNDLWNGKYYRAYGNTTGVKRDTCHAGQLAGEVFSRMLCEQDVVEEAHLRSTVDALLSLNGSAAITLPPDEATPDGKAATPFGWLPYVEGYLLTAAACAGDARFLPVWQRVVNAYDGNGAHPCDTRLMYRPLSGQPSWGHTYMTAPASWLLYYAWLDFFYTPGDGMLRLRTGMPGRYPIIHPLFWATAEVAQDGTTTLTIQRLFTDQPLLLSSLDAPASVPAIEMLGHPLRIIKRRGSYRRFRLPEPVALKAGTTVSWKVR